LLLLPVGSCLALPCRAPPCLTLPSGTTTCCSYPFLALPCRPAMPHLAIWDNNLLLLPVPCFALPPRHASPCPASPGLAMPHYFDGAGNSSTIFSSITVARSRAHSSSVSGLSLMMYLPKACSTCCASRQRSGSRFLSPGCTIFLDETNEYGQTGRATQRDVLTRRSCAAYRGTGLCADADVGGEPPSTTTRVPIFTWP
jgi:hypothetical protein